MATAGRITVNRQDRAAGIVERRDAVPVDGTSWRVRDIAGSGHWHRVTTQACDCYDAHRGHACKHMQAVQRETAALAAYAAAWDAQAGPRCPQCPAQLVTRQYYVGGRGYVYLEVCLACGDDAPRLGGRHA
jgi:hypothetical protein